MNPVDICQRVLGPDKLSEIIGKLSSPQIKAALKEGGIKVKLPAGIVSQQRRRALWSTRILAAVEQRNEALASEVLQQWLLHHHRAMLVRYLDILGVKHRDGETEDSFLLSCPRDQVHDAARRLLAEHDASEVRAYLHYIAHQQRASVFEDFAPMQADRREAPGEPDGSEQTGADGPADDA